MKALAVSLMLVGALFMVAAIFISLQFYRQVPEKLVRRWNLMTGLMVFFLIGCLAFAFDDVDGFVFPRTY